MASVQDILNFLNIKNRYVELFELGRGGMGQVASVFDHHLQRVVARKRLMESRVVEEQMVKAFANEIKLVSYLDHPGVINVYDAEIDQNGVPCYSMRQVEGRDLQTIINEAEARKRLPMSLDAAIKLIEKISETLAYVHDRGVIHLDIKPGNIRVGQYGEVTIMDWGTACLFDSEKYSENLRRFTDDIGLLDITQDIKEVFVGTPKYMSPEQTQHTRGRLTPASDIFSVGVIFYQLLTGIHPFPGRSLPDLIHNLRSVDPDPPHEVNGNIPRRLSVICMKMLKKQKTERYLFFNDVLKDLEDFRDSGGSFPVKTFETGEVIFREGDSGDYACQVVTGCVGISVVVGGAHKTIARVYSNEPFGELSIISDTPRTATATALERTRIRMMRREHMNSELAKLSPWIGHIVTSLSNRFIEQNKKIRDLEAKLQTHHNAQFDRE